jgi:RNA polymerase primary sigma factor
MDGVFRAAALRRFGAGEIQALVAPRTLDEGVDVPEASLAVIVAGTRVKRQSVQRIGRVLRRTAEKREAKVLKIFVRGAADDPTLRSRDPFSSMMLASGRASIRLWPLDAGEIIDFILPAHQPGPTVLTRT